MTTREIFEIIQYLDRICDYYEPKMVCNYGMVVTEAQAEAQNRYSKADAKRKELIELLEDRVYKGLEIDNEIINNQVEKQLEEIQGKTITKEDKRRRNVQKVKKETI
jgi:predicted DNA-binding WGR domain protein